ncbi:Gfo/Idh/MocA family protein [Streptomyces virginiae]|uniref:Gfo/Idh/MocA family protein n=1 Tax=Streptomyces virginiae TaxID=1961 RepID=UPI0036C44CBA
MRSLLIGAGGHGGDTLLPAACSAGLPLSAIVDQDAERAKQLAAQWMIPQTYASAGEVDTSVFDAALIALPVTAQADHAAWAIKAGLHTFVEKPPAPDLDGLRALITLTRQAGVRACVGMNFRWAEGVRKLVEVLESGRYGTVRCVRVEHMARKPVTTFGPDMSLAASLFAAQGIHAIDLAQMLLPGQTSTTGQMIKVERGCLCSMVATDPGAGTRLEVQFGSCQAGFYHSVQVTTSRGDLLHLRDLSELQLRPSGGDPHVSDYPGARVLWRRSPTSGGYAHAGYGPELGAFRDLLRGADAPRHLARLEDLLPVYEAFDLLLKTEGLSWTA